MKKRINLATVGKVVAASATMVEGICASIVVDSALKVVPGNKYVNLIGRTGVTSLISTVFTVAAAGIMSIDTSDDDDTDDNTRLYKLTIVDSAGEKHKKYYKAGDRIIIDATPMMGENDEFMYWYFSKGHATIETEGAQCTSIIMPDENVRLEFVVFSRCDGSEKDTNDEDVCTGDESNHSADVSEVVPEMICTPEIPKKNSKTASNSCEAACMED